MYFSHIDFATYCASFSFHTLYINSVFASVNCCETNNI